MPAPLFCHKHRVTYADCTVGNHVYHSRYLDLLEAARGELFRHAGQSLLQWQQAGAIFPVTECQMRFRAPARYDDVLSIEVWPSAVDRVRLRFGHRILTGDDRLILEAETCHVCTGLEGKPRRLPEELAQVLDPIIRSDLTRALKGLRCKTPDSL
jgi:acyl-CoA thioester hydrolase